MLNKILDKAAIKRIITRLAYQIVEHNFAEKAVILAGVAPAGLVLCHHLKNEIAQISTINCEVMAINVDKKSPKNLALSQHEGFDDKTIIIVDDVSMTGRTICYSMVPFLAYYPKKLQTLVLVEREQKQFPIHSDFVGMHISTTLQELITVEVENDEIVGAFLS